MKMKKIESICKDIKEIFIYTDRKENQWLGDGRAMYLLSGLPTLAISDIFTMFDISDRKSADYITNLNYMDKEKKKPITIRQIETLIENIDNYKSNENEHFTDVVVHRGKKQKLCSIVTKGDLNNISWLDTKYLSPLEESAQTLVIDDIVILFDEDDNALAVVNTEFVFYDEFAFNLYNVANITKRITSERDKNVR